MKRNILYALLPLMVSCSTDGGNVSRYEQFAARERTAEVKDMSHVPGGLTLRIINAMPQVRVPEPHPPTVFHINARLCSISQHWVNAPGAVGAHDEEPDTDEPQSAAEGEVAETSAQDEAPLEEKWRNVGRRNCLDLAPTIYAHSGETFYVSPEQVQELLNNDYTALEVTFMSSAQASQMFYGCTGADNGIMNVARMPYDAERPNRRTIRIDGQTSLMFRCTSPG